MWLDLILFSFVIGLLRKGRLKALPQFHGIYWLVASIAVQLVSVFFHTKFGNALVSVSYIITLIFFYLNREKEEFRILSIGWFLNAVAIWTNSGKMPIDLEQAQRTPYSTQPLIDGTDFKHSIITDSTHFPFLGDIFYLPFPIVRIISVGDIFIAIGIFFLIQRFMDKPFSLLHLRGVTANVTKSNE